MMLVSEIGDEPSRSIGHDAWGSNGKVCDKSYRQQCAKPTEGQHVGRGHGVHV